MWWRHYFVLLLHGVLITGVFSASTTSWMFIQPDDDEINNQRTVRHIEKENEYMETTNCTISEHRIANCPKYDKNKVFTGIYTGMNSAKKYLEAVSYQIKADLEKEDDDDLSPKTRAKLREIAEELEYQTDYLDELLTALYSYVQPSNYNQQYTATTYRAHESSEDLNQGTVGTSGYYAFPYQSSTNTGTRVLYTQPSPASTSSAYYTFLQNGNPTYQQQTNPSSYNQPLAVLVHQMY